MKATRDGYGKGLLEFGAQNDRVVALDADLSESTRSAWFGAAYPDRFFQMGISEQDMIISAAGLAHEGFIPFASTFAIFMERAWEQVRNGIARPDLNVKVVGSHGGILTGEDGSSAHAIEDVGLYRMLPTFTVVVPVDAIQAEKAVWTLGEHVGPVYLKLTRNKVANCYPDDHEFKIGPIDVLREGTDLTIIGCGSPVHEALIAAADLQAEGLSVAVLNAATIKPFDAPMVLQWAQRTGHILTVEDHLVWNGLGSAVAETLAEAGSSARLGRVGLRDYTQSGTPEDLYRTYGLDAAGIAKSARELMSTTGGQSLLATEISGGQV